eukprot:TRINITY_DN1052_c0_g1_i1.p1 TRINITY_DN1052_c0_g1~~TRINITY_DN1052_c0_g1_i1.p1  ORF type:complete len:276 (-),score=65.87 TRINITY_DN1052_c0_g1_i1:45-872(-)
MTTKNVREELVTGIELSIHKLILTNEGGFRNRLFDAMEDEYGLWKWEPGRFDGLTMIYQKAFDLLVVMCKYDYRKALVSGITGVTDVETDKKVFRKCLKYACAKVVSTVYESHARLMSKLIKLIAGSLNLKAYADMLPYQMASLMWLDLTADSGRSEVEIYPIAEMFVGQMYLIPYADGVNPAADIQVEDANKKMLGYLRLACHVTADVLQYGAANFLRFDLAVQQYFLKEMPQSYAVELYGGKFSRGWAKLTGSIKEDTKYGLISVDNSRVLEA